MVWENRDADAQRPGRAVPQEPGQVLPQEPGPALPEIVFAPAHPVRRGGRTDVEFEVRELANGTRALPVFTTTRQLIAALGPEQPWAALPLRNARALMSAAGVDQVVLDPAAQSDAWRWQHEDLEALERWLG
jgi:SseB protein N-terminal domain